MYEFYHMYEVSLIIMLNLSKILKITQTKTHTQTKNLNP